MRGTISLTTNGDYWKADWRDNAGKKHSRSLGSRKKVSKGQARRAIRDMEVELRLNPGSVQRRGHAPTFAVWRKHFIALKKADISARAVLNYERTFDYLEAHFGSEYHVDRITPAEADDWRLWLIAEHKLSDTTIANHVRQAKTIFNRLVKRQEISHNPFVDLTSTAPIIVRECEIEGGAVDTLLEYLPSEWRVLVALCALAGLRLGEARALEWDDIDWARQSINVRGGKTGARRVRMDGELDRLLIEAYQVGQTGRIVTLSANNLHRQMVKHITRAGLKPWAKPFHALRGWRSDTWKRVYPEYVVDAWLGHSQEVARRHYNTVPDEFYQETQDGKTRSTRESLRHVD